MTSKLQKLNEGAKELWKTTIGSRKAVEYAQITAYLLTNPAKLTFKIFFHLILDSLHPRPQCEKAEFTEDQLKEFLDYAILSKEVYNEPAKRTIPKEINHIIFEDPNSNIDKTPYFIVNSEERNKIILAVRGSYTFGDFFTDVKASAINVDGILMHNGVF